MYNLLNQVRQMRLPSFARVPFSLEKRRRGSLVGQRDVSLRKWTGYFTEAGLEERFLLFRQGGRRPVFFLIVLALFIFEIVDTIRDPLTNSAKYGPLEIFRKTTKIVGTSCFMVLSWWFPFPFKYFEKAVGVLVVVTSFLLSWATDRFVNLLAGLYDEHNEDEVPPILTNETLNFSILIGVYTAVVVIMPLRRPTLIVTLAVSYVFGASAVAVSIPKVAVIGAGYSRLVYNCIAALLSSAAVLVAVVFSLTNEEFYARLMFSKIGAQKKKIEMLNDEMEDLLKAKSAGSAGERLVGILNEATKELQKHETLLESTEGPEAPASSPAFTAEQTRRLIKKLREATALASNAEHLLDINLSQTVKQLDALARLQSPREQTEAPQPIPLARQSGEAETMREGNQKGSMISLVSSETGDANHADERQMMQFLSANFVRQRSYGGVTRPRRVTLSPQSNEAGGVGTGTLLRLATTKPEMDEAVNVVLKPFEAHLPTSLSSVRNCRDFGTLPPSPPLLTLADRHSSERVPAREWNLDLTALQGQEVVLTNDLVGLGGQSPVSPARQHKSLIHPEDLHVGGALPPVGLALLRPFIVTLSARQGSTESSTFFLWSVQSGYSTQASYQNAVHGADVALMTVWLTEHVGVRPFLSPVRNVSIVIAALCRDVGHEGVNNMFHINSSSDLAVNYNDRSILESFHAAQTFRLMQKPGCNILSKLGPEDRKMARSSIIDLILDTDMKKHFEFVAAMKLRLKDPEFASSLCGDTWGSPSSSSEKNKEVMEQDVWMVTRACLKAADLGKPVRPNFGLRPCSAGSVAGVFEIGSLLLSCMCRELYVELSRVEMAARESPRDSPSQKKPPAMNQMLGPGQISSVCLANMDENVEKWKLPETTLQVPSQLFDPPPVAPSEPSSSIKSRTPRRDTTRESPFAVLPSQTPEKQEKPVPEQTELTDAARVTSGSASALQHKDKVGKGAKLDQPSGDDEKPPDCSKEASLVD
uniref:PDEase domain-containing protein n=1 Tax=Chromera velia CCMP2878 TaxID=1169474 RepID=A0A0G4I976_9ALVE|eukprot:Cvel_12081.t1-p1 / transcript=Cvel_12081.t1 / gene=Cvel_12081 / organism=Chromera_velia_CCMP2878 / gene_product=cAMP-specific 3',5'-cAMP phosphodiesterase 4, putative / transcript_product=cAMP-specific 3',5'-cAMP phosphodiesterase 4, putative / location=Cvel_scaffold777:49146-55561(+) / protein_length=987 / sequence_SO=supercontig / SO=protein_coding / is_pseudo=false